MSRQREPGNACFFCGQFHPAPPQVTSHLPHRPARHRAERLHLLAQRSKRFLQAQYRMCKVGVRVMPPGREGGAARAARLTNPGFDYNPLVWGHVNERLPKGGGNGRGSEGNPDAPHTLGHERL